MNNLKKIGLTALASSLIATSAFAGEMSVTGSASITLVNQDNHDVGNTFSSGDSINFSGSGELDNGLMVEHMMTEVFLLKFLKLAQLSSNKVQVLLMEVLMM